MAKSILITGGARSGKSRIAESWVAELAPARVYIATAEPRDAEMEARIAAHAARRGEGWTTFAEPLDLVGALSSTDGAPRIVDCLTLWLSNLMETGSDWQAEARALAEAIPKQQSPVVFVTNEVGLGIVPETALGRKFRDAQGAVNQTIAASVDEVYLAVSGYPLKVK
jgi:adenosylcobinamide kinase/adenosylcobinamide-phosphate guanylyltransferase